MPGTWTYIIDEPRRTELLKSYGLPEVAIALGQDGDWPHEMFGFCCRKPVTDLDAKQGTEGDLVVAIYETDVDESYGVRKRGDGLEFVYISLKKPDEVIVIGTSITSFYGALLEDVMQSDSYTRSEFYEASAVLGFERIEDIYEWVLKDRSLDVRGYYDRRFKFLPTLS